MPKPELSITVKAENVPAVRNLLDQLHGALVLVRQVSSWGPEINERVDAAIAAYEAVVNQGREL